MAIFLLPALILVGPIFLKPASVVTSRQAVSTSDMPTSGQQTCRMHNSPIQSLMVPTLSTPDSIGQICLLPVSAVPRCRMPSFIELGFFKPTLQMQNSISRIS